MLLSCRPGFQAEGRGIKFLSYDEVYVRAAVALRSEHLVETVCPVETHEAYHREEHAHTYSGRAFHVEGVELLYVVPCVAAFGKGQGVDVCGAFEHERVAQLEREARICVALIVERGSEAAVFVTAQADCLGGVS